MANKNIRACIVGASGYTGVELIRLLNNHPNVSIDYLAADSNSGKKMAEIYAHLGIYDFPTLVNFREVDWSKVDVAFCCLPHATTHEVASIIPSNVKIIDLSADFRIHDVDTYEYWYGIKHSAPELQKTAVYALSEIYRKEIKDTRIVACPGCYPTSALLPLIPLVKNKMISTEGIIIDSKSGITGAGRSAKQDNLFAEINEGLKAYGICNHRHIAEIEQALSQESGSEVRVNFSPQVVPMNRGILSTIYVKNSDSVSTDDIRNYLAKFYKDEKFVHVLPENYLPSTRHVYSTNHCLISAVKGRSKDVTVLVSVIDNLVKGASGQAVQNMNLIFSLDELTGLHYTPVFP